MGTAAIVAALITAAIGAGKTIAGAVQARKARKAIQEGIARGDKEFAELEKYLPQLDEIETNYFKDIDKGAVGEALAKLKQQSETGYTEEDKMAEQKALEEVAQQERANRGSMQSEYARRGMAGGGQEMAANLAGAQSASNVRGNVARDSAIEAQKRALAALRDSMSANLDINKTKANAQFEIDKYNNALRQQSYDNRANLAGAKAANFTNSTPALTSQQQQGGNLAMQGLDQLGNAANTGFNAWLNSPNKNNSDASLPPMTLGKDGKWKTADGTTYEW
jgi:hypothetical protein